MSNNSPEQFKGIGVDAYFKGADKTTPPFPAAGGLKSHMPFDDGIVSDAVRRGETTSVDPTTLRSTQPWITRTGVDHYTQSSELYADANKAGNKHPVIYHRQHPLTGETHSLILSGHHRAAAALLKGENLDAIEARGGFGRKRGA